MRRVGGLFDQAVSFPSLLSAFRKAFRGSGKTPEACGFHFRMEPELLELKRELESGVYRPRRYRYFQIREPKERTVSVASFRDRVVHHAVVAALEPIFEKRFIFHSYATRKGKGTHRAVRKAMECVKRYPYYLKADIEKYFESIDHDVLLSMTEKVIKDSRLLALVEVIIRNNDLSQDKDDGKGLPIGNLTSQFFANVYLDGFDHFVLERLKAGPYIRYMDDFVVFSNNRVQLREVREDVRDYLRKNLCLTLKDVATFINCRANGLPFLGFRAFPSTMRLKRENVGRLKKKIRLRAREYMEGTISEQGFRQSLASIFGYLDFADTFRLRNSCFANNG